MTRIHLHRRQPWANERKAMNKLMIVVSTLICVVFVNVSATEKRQIIVQPDSEKMAQQMFAAVFEQIGIKDVRLAIVVFKAGAGVTVDACLEMRQDTNLLVRCSLDQAKKNEVPSKIRQEYGDDSMYYMFRIRESLIPTSTFSVTLGHHDKYVLFFKEWWKAVP
jgi:hypothetical protein